MGIGEFFKSLAQIIGYALIVLGFALYVSYREYLETFPKYIVVIGIFLIVTFGLLLVLYRNSSRTKLAKENGVEEKIVHITPLDELKHDILALVTFGTILIWVTFTGRTIDGNDIAQAAIAYAAVLLVRKIYRERFY